MFNKIFSTLLFLTVFLMIFPDRVQATTTVSGSITTDTTWTTAASPYVIDGDALTINTGVTLTIEPGVVVKLNGEHLTVSGTVVAAGTADDPITFTSFYDDTVGGDTNGDGASTAAAPGDWEYVSFASGSSGNLDHVVMQYGGAGSAPAMMLYILANDVTVQNSTLQLAEDSVLMIDSASPTVTNTIIDSSASSYTYPNSISGDGAVLTGSTFIGSTVINPNQNCLWLDDSTNVTLDGNSFTGCYAGIRMSGDASGVITNNTITGLNFGFNITLFWADELTISSNIISGNTYGMCTQAGTAGAMITDNIFSNNVYGLKVNNVAGFTLSQNIFVDNTLYAMYADEVAVMPVEAENNWWGDSTGPYHSSTNPSGLGDTVSDYVIFDPWLISYPAVDTTAPADVTLSTIEKDPWNKTITLNWTNPTDGDFDHVIITRTDRLGIVTTLIDTETGTSYIDSSISYGMRYTYTLSTVDATGNVSVGVTTDPKRVKRPAMHHLRVHAFDTAILARWEHLPLRSDPAVGYLVYYGTSPENITTSIDVGDTTTVTIPELTVGERYYVVVAAYNADGVVGPLSSIKSVMLWWKRPCNKLSSPAYHCWLHR